MSKAAWVRIAPFAVFMAFIGFEELLGSSLISELFPFDKDVLLYTYLFRIGVVAFLLLMWMRHYYEIRVIDLLQWRQTLFSIVLGYVIFWLWIHMDWDFAVMGTPQGFNPEVYREGIQKNAMLGARFFGAVIVVPVMEELFWRSFLLRYVIDANFLKVAIGRFTWFSFLAITVLFGLEHHFVLAGIMAGALFNLVVYKTGSIMQCILCHAVANLALGVYVLQSGRWIFW